jgi:hypothetical protein
LYLRADFELGDDGYEEDDKIDTLYVSVDMEALRPDLTDLFRALSPTELEVWEFVTYDFPLDGTTPFSYAGFFYKDLSGEEPARLTKSQKRFLKRAAGREGIDENRDVELNTQDKIDIHNALLVLEVPDGIVTLN